MKTQNIKVTTTNGFDGVEIEEYLEPITAHVVVGMNFFKDFMSGLSDFFGGKSKTYQNTLTSIDTEVINVLRKKAASLGANCILGMKIDNDEISAQGKSMMMVTALGTAAKANFSKKPQAPERTSLDSVPFDTFKFLKQKERYIMESKKSLLTIDDKLWNFIKTNKIDELSDYVTNKYISIFERHIEYDEPKNVDFYNNLQEYLSIIDPEVAINSLYSAIKSDLTPNQKNKLIELISESHLIDFEKIMSLIKNSDFQVQKFGIQILKSDKLIYEKSDLANIEALLNLLPEIFKEKGEVTTKKKALSSKEKEIWKCQCGKENNIDNKYCSSCNKDIYGFSDKEVNPKDILEKLEIDLKILKRTIL